MPIMRNYRVSRGGSQAKSLLLISLAAIFLAFFAFSQRTVAKSCEDISDDDDQIECYSDEIADATKKRSEWASKLEQFKKDLSATTAELNEIQAEIDGVRAALVNINKNLEVRRVSLGEKLQLRDSIVRAHYQEGRLTDLEFFLYLASDTSGFRYSTLIYIFDKSLADEALKVIDRLNNEISNFENDKAAAEKLQADLVTDQASLVALKAQIDANRATAEKEVASLDDKIADLSAKQQEILAAKAGAGVVSGYEAPEYKLPDSPYSPGFAAMSYGAYTHYKGMSQYGAKGRAQDGDSYEDIIEFYYNEGVDEKDNFPDEICVEGHGDMDFQEYLYGLAEMPSSWPKAALKAQAVAGRSYAYNRTKNGGCICTTQSCQVFSESKSDSPPGAWKDAVDETEGEIIGGSLGASGYGWYSSTTGGYIDNIGWDEDGDWPSGAYEKKAKSPWFYKAWYTETYNDNSSKCGRSTPWLDSEEMADILNAWVVWKEGSSDERKHITPVTTSCWGGDPYSHGEMKDKADKYGTAYGSVSNVANTSQGNNGQTQSVTFSTNNGSVTINGSEFKTVFNLRAPGYVSLRSRLFDIEVEN